MAKEKIEALVEGGKATAAPPLGPALGPMGVNVGQVVAEINRKTEAFKGMKVPVKVMVDKSTKEFSVEVGTPPTSQLIKKELGLETGSGMPDKEFTGNVGIEQVIKVAKMKMDSLLVTDLKSAVKTVAGSCSSLGVLVEGMRGADTCKAIEEGRFDAEIKAGKTEVSAEKKAQLKAQLEAVQAEVKKRLEKLKAEEEAEAGEKKEEKKEGEAAAAGEKEAGAEKKEAGKKEPAAGEKKEAGKKEAPKKEEKKK